MLLKEREEALCSRMCTDLGRFMPGSRFYSVRQMLDRYRVSRRVIDAAVETLVSRQVLEVRPNCGIFVRRSEQVCSVTYFYLDWPGETVKELIAHLTAQFAAMQGGIRFSACSYSYDADLVGMLRLCPADAIIIGYPARSPKSEELQYFRESERPIITLERDLKDVGLHSTSGSPELGAFLAVQHFMSRGHRRLAVLPAQPRAGEVGRRVDAFLRMARFSGCEVREIPCRVEDGDYASTRAYESLSADLAEHGCDYTGLFLPTDDPCKGALLAFHEAGIRVPDDVSLIGYGFAAGPEYFTPPVTTVACRPEDCARSLVAALQRYFGGDRSVIAIRDVPVVIERSSVAAARSAGESVRTPLRSLRTGDRRNNRFESNPNLKGRTE